MPAEITQSVGHGGINAPADVRIVQQLLQRFVTQERLTAPRGDGVIDPPTLIAIIQFQTRAMNILVPDGRIDPGGKTMRALVAHAAAANPAPVTPAATGGGAAVPVTYGHDVPVGAQIVSDYAIKVIRKALAMAGMKAAVMTSTLRLPQEQAETMYKNAAKSLDAQYKLYGATGDEILKIYEKNRTKPKADVIALMRKKIEDQLAAGKQVSRHVTTVGRYAALNVVDIGVNSTRAAAGTTFDMGKLTKAFTKLEADGYIRKFIDETSKSNTCWHLEIVPDAKPL